MIKRLRFFFDVIWRPALYYLLLLMIGAGVLFYHLGRLAPGVAGPEQEWYKHLVNRDLGLRNILDNPAFLPYQLAVYVLEKLNVHSITALRAISAGFGLLAVSSFYFSIRSWYTRRMALIGSSLLLCSGWFLHTARLAGTDILYLSPVILIACGLWLNSNRRPGSWPLAFVTIVSTVLLYVPSLFWLLLGGLIWQRRRLMQELDRMKGWQLGLAITVSALIIAPLVRLAFTDRPMLQTFLGLPQHVPSLNTYLHALLDIPKQLFIRGPQDPAVWVGAMPILDIFMIAMFILGIYVYLLRARLDRVKILFSFLFIACLFIAAGGPVRLVLLLPFVFLVIVAGIAYYLQQWFDVFPRNPFARTLASTLLIAAVAMSCFFNLNHYFVAWPHAPETKASLQRL